MTPRERALRERVEELEETVKQLKDLLQPPTIFPVGWGLTPSERKVLAYLYSRSPGICLTENIASRISTREREGTSLTVIRTTICRIRRKIPPIAIFTSYGEGYWMPLSSRQYLSSHLQDTP